MLGALVLFALTLYYGAAVVPALAGAATSYALFRAALS